MKMARRKGTEQMQAGAANEGWLIVGMGGRRRCE
jgi:hypothetical protein